MIHSNSQGKMRSETQKFIQESVQRAWWMGKCLSKVRAEGRFNSDSFRGGHSSADADIHARGALSASRAP